MRRKPEAPDSPATPSTTRRTLLAAAGATAVAASIPGDARAQTGASPGAGDRGPALRSPDRANRPRTASLPPPSIAVMVHTRLAFGPRPGDLAAFGGYGPDPDSRLSAWLDEQLDPQSIPDPEVDARLASGFSTLGKSRTRLWTDHVVNDTSYSQRIRPFEETERATLIRAIWSRRQLFEVLVDFWHNHFNVYGRHYMVAPMFVHYDRDVIRAHALGNFRDLLEAVAKSTAMLYYLDNYTSSNGGPNENFARELFELHTLGAENYLGIRRQNEVPTDSSGRPVGYVDDDVYEATRCFTGWTVSNSSHDAAVGNTGEFHYRAEWHDRFQKNVLGEFIPADQPAEKDGQDVLDALASHPGTGRHVARKLIRRLLTDDPPQSLVDQAAQTFTDHWQAPDQIARVVRTIVTSPEFRTTWGAKVRRPLETVAATLRATGTRLDFQLGADDSSSFFWYLEHTGQRPFHWKSPDGHPDLAEDWVSTSTRVATWRLVNWLLDERDDGGVYRFDVVARTPASWRSAEGIVDFWTERILGRRPPTAEYREMVDFMAQGRNPGYDLPLTSDEEVQTRARSLVALIFMSPEFQWR